MLVKGKSGGFTMIELVLVLLVVAIMAAISVSSLSAAQAGQEFNNNFEQLLSFFNNARTNAIASKGFRDYTDYDRDGSSTDLVTPANYGVYINKTAGTLTLFADIHPNQSCTMTCGSRSRYNTSPSNANGKDQTIKTYTFPSKYALKLNAVQMDSTQILPNGSSYGTGSIFYSPLYADVTAQTVRIDFSDNPPTNSHPFFRIQLSETNGPRCRQIKIHQLAGVPEVGPCQTP